MPAIIGLLSCRWIIQWMARMVVLKPVRNLHRIQYNFMAIRREDNSKSKICTQCLDSQKEAKFIWLVILESNAGFFLRDWFEILNEEKPVWKLNSNELCLLAQGYAAWAFSISYLKKNWSLFRKIFKYVFASNGRLSAQFSHVHTHANKYDTKLSLFDYSVDKNQLNTNKKQHSQTRTLSHTHTW